MYRAFLKVGDFNTKGIWQNFVATLLHCNFPHSIQFISSLWAVSDGCGDV